MVFEHEIHSDSAQGFLATTEGAAICPIKDVIAGVAGWVERVRTADIVGAAQAVVAEVVRRVDTFSRDAGVDGARIVVITIDRHEDTPATHVTSGRKAIVRHRTEVVIRGVHTPTSDATVT